MKIVFPFLVAFAFITGLSSCQQEIDEMFDPFSDNSYIQKVISFDTTKPPGLDTGFVSLYEYDPQKRLSKLAETEYDMGTLYTNYYKFFYNGNDTVPSKIINTSNYANDSLVTFFYYISSIVIKDSTISFLNSIPVDATIGHYSSFGSGRFLSRVYTESPVSSGTIINTDSIIYTRNFVNGNILGGQDSTWHNGIFFNALNFQSVFDTKKSPYTKLLRWYTGYYQNLPAGAFVIIQGNNNVRSHPYTYSPGGPDMTGISYDYNIKNYPVVGRVTGGDYNKIVFIYTNL